MNLLQWIFGRFSIRSKSLTAYKIGMQKAKKGDFAGAVEEYTKTIRGEGVPQDVLGMAIYNRSLAYSALHQDDKAAEDLKSVLEMQGLPESIRVAANQRRERIRRREG